VTVRSLGLARFLWMAVAALTAVVVAGCGVVTPAAPTPTAVPTPTKGTSQGPDLVILYTSDVEGVVEGTIVDTDGVQDWTIIGGLTRRAAFIASVRSSVGNADLLVVDGGNTFWGTWPSAVTKQSQGQVMVEAMNQMGYDAMALGESELQLDADVLRQRIADARFPVLSANVVVQSSGELLTAPYALLEVGGRKIGIIGLTGTGASQAIGSLSIRDAAATVAGYVKELESQTNIIVVLSDLGWEADVRLAEAVSGIDVIVGAGDPRVGTDRWQPPQSHTVVYQIAPTGRPSLGRVATLIRLGVDSTGVVTTYSGGTFTLDGRWPDDADMQHFLDSYPAR